MRIFILLLMFLGAGTSWAFSFSDIGMEAGFGGRYASYAHQEGNLAYEIDELYLFGLTYSVWAIYESEL